MTLAAAVRVVAIACAGVLAGIYLGYYAGPQDALHALSASSFVQFQQIVHTHYVKFMPVLVLGALASTLGWLLLARPRWRSPEFWLIAASVAGLAIIAGLTRMVSVPLNDQLMTWSIASPPADLRTLWEPWERVNTTRGVLAVCVVVFEAIALNLRAGRG